MEFIFRPKENRYMQKLDERYQAKPDKEKWQEFCHVTEWMEPNADDNDWFIIGSIRQCIIKLFGTEKFKEENNIYRGNILRELMLDLQTLYADGRNRNNSTVMIIERFVRTKMITPEEDESFMHTCVKDGVVQ